MSLSEQIERWLGRTRAGSRVPGLVSVALESTGFTLAHVVRSLGGAPHLERLDHRVCDDRAALGLALRSAVDEWDLSGARTSFVLGPSEYALRAVDAPDVPDVELRGAVRWTLGDMVDFPIEKAAVDVYEIPRHGGPGCEGREGRRVYAVAAPEEVVDEVIEIAGTAGLELAAIDTTELAIRNVAALHGRDEAGLALVYLRSDIGLISLTRGGLLYVARWVDLGLDDLLRAVEKNAAGEASFGEGAVELEALVLEMQRSLDYYDHELRQQPVSGLALAGPGLDALGVYLSDCVRLPVDTLRLRELVAIERAPSDAPLALPALGGALRSPEGPC